MCERGVILRIYLKNAEIKAAQMEKASGLRFFTPLTCPPEELILAMEIVVGDNIILRGGDPSSVPNCAATQFASQMAMRFSRWDLEYIMNEMREPPVIYPN
jgi:hypothetical protein